VPQHLALRDALDLERQCRVPRAERPQPLVVVLGTEGALGDAGAARCQQRLDAVVEERDAGEAELARPGAVAPAKRVEELLFDAVLEDERHAEVCGESLAERRLARAGWAGNDD